MESCPFKDAAAPPCRIAVHPDMPEVRYCEICRLNYDIRNVGNRFELFPFLIVATIFVVFFQSVIYDEPAEQETQESRMQPIEQLEREML
jgi:hypothetical protein